MDAVVLAAGEGTRLRPLTEDKPKGMVEVADQPLLTHCFDQVIDLGAEQLVVVVGYMKEKIIDHYGDEYRGVPITLPAQTEGAGPCVADCGGARRRRFHAPAWGQRLSGQSRRCGHPTSGAAS